jgi:hypothetical protein
MTEAFVVATLGNFLANILADACREIYDQWIKQTPSAPPAIDRDRIDAVVTYQLKEVTPSRLAGAHSTSDDIAAITRFLTTRDLGNLASDALAIHVLGLSDTSAPDIHRQCEDLLKYYGLSPIAAPIAAGNLMQLIHDVVRACTEAIDPNPPAGVKKQAREAHEERIAAYERLKERQLTRLTDQLSTLADLIDRDHVGIAALHRKVERLRIAVSQVHGTLTPPSLEGTSQIPLDELYVPPSLEVTTIRFGIQLQSAVESTYVRRETASNRVYEISSQLDDLLRQHRRFVILGTPGAGKTSLARYAARHVCTRPRSDGGPEVSFPIVLRELREPVITGSGVDVVEAVRVIARNRYQVELSPSEATFLCGSGRFLLVIDGLDELLDVGLRSAVASSIEAFAAVYPRCALAVTSRTVSYKHVSLDRRMFAVSTVVSFDHHKVSMFASKWFEQYDLPPSQRRALVRSFLRESSAVDDLRQNPLMLSLMCSVYRYQNYIPRNRPQVFADCAKLMHHLWDRRRGLLPAFEFNVDEVVQFLAYWIFTSPDRRAGVNEVELVSAASAHLHGLQYRRRSDAEQAAEKLVAFCRDRAWIFSASGLASDGTAVFEFSHQTFLEYFVAKHLFGELDSDGLLSFLLEHCVDSAWQMVCQILIQLAPGKQKGLEDTVINAVLDSLRSYGRADREVALSLCAATLGAVPLRPGTIERVVEEALREFLTQVFAAPSTGPDSGKPVAGRDYYWLNSANVAIENLREASHAIKDRLNALVLRSPRSPRGDMAKAVAHLFDFAFVDGVTPAEFGSYFSDDCIDAILGLMRGDRAAWLESVALLARFRVDRIGLTRQTPLTLAARNSFASPSPNCSPLLVPWGNQPAPNVFEIIVWWAINSGPDDREFLEAVMVPRAVEVYPLIRDTRIRFRPHGLWFDSRDEGLRGSKTSPTDVVPAELLAMAADISFTLADRFLAVQDDKLAEERLNDVAHKRWGNLDFVGAAVRARHGLSSEGMSEQDVALIGQLGLSRWL